MTRVVRVDPEHPDPARLAEAGAVLRSGGLVAFPTETVYGLGANALDPAAVARIFAAKGRPAHDPLIVHIAAVDEAARVAAAVPERARALWARFAPGPLTLILPKHPAVPAAVTAGKPTVAVRIPAHPVALGLIRAAGVPIAAPSANKFGHTSPTTAQHVLDDLGAAVDWILDAGPTPVGVESTIVDVTVDPPALLRPGGVPREALEDALGGPVVWRGDVVAAEDVRAPGMLPRHYAPRVPLWLFEGPRAWAREALWQTAAQLARGQGQRVGALVPHADAARLRPLGVVVADLGPEHDPAGMARRLFAGLRDLEAAGVEVILARTVAEQDVGLAIADRLRRAAAHIVRPASRAVAS